MAARPLLLQTCYFQSCSLDGVAYVVEDLLHAVSDVRRTPLQRPRRPAGCKAARYMQLTSAERCAMTSTCMRRQVASHINSLQQQRCVVELP